MTDKPTFRLRRKQDGFITEPITAEQAKTLAGYPADFERVDEVKPLVVKDKASPAPRAPAKGKTGGKGGKGKSTAAKKPEPTPAPAALTETAKQD